MSRPSGTNTTNLNLRCTFEAQVFRKNRCKKCLRDKSEHDEPKTGTGKQSNKLSSLPTSSANLKASNGNGTVNLAPAFAHSSHAGVRSGLTVLPVAEPTAVVNKTDAGGSSGTLENVPGILRKPNTPAAIDALKIIEKPPPAATTSRARPLVKPMADNKDSDNILNTTTQTIILSKTSPQIRRASASSSGEPQKHGSRSKSSTPVSRRFSAADEGQEADDRQMQTPLSGSLSSMGTAVESASDLMSMHTATSGSNSSLNSATTYISSREQFQETVDEMQATINALTDQLDQKNIAIREMEDLTNDLRDQLSTPLKSGTSSGGSFKRRDDLHSAQKRIKELEKENHDHVNYRQHLEIQLDQVRECMDEVNDPDDARQPLIERVRDVMHKLQSAEMMCEDLMDDNEELKKELRSLESEMDELHDNFRQDQAMEFQTIQKDLEQTMKNCRILQFKLRKSERRCDEVEEDKARYEIKLRQMTSIAPAGTSDSLKYRELENEMRELTDVNRRMQEQIEHLEEEKNAMRNSFDAMNKSYMELEKQKEGYRMQAERTKPDSSSSNHSSSSNQEYDINQLLRDLCDSVERETDLRDQLKFSEDEAKRLRKQGVDMEHENDSLRHQLKKISSARHSGDFSKASDAVDSMVSADETKMQLEVAEHEISSLKRRLTDSEQENENLSSDYKKLKISYEELRIAKDKIAAILEEPESSGPGKARSYYEQKIKLLESETNDLRRKLVDKERHLERVSAEIEAIKRKNPMQRSKSLEDYQVVDLKRQLQMAEQEIILMRQKVQALENDHDRLSAENKRLQFRVQSKRGSTDELEVGRPAKSVDEGGARGNEELERYRPDIVVLSAAGKTAKELLQECARLSERAESLEKVIVAAREQFEKSTSKSLMRKDIATRQELKTRIDELETELQSAYLFAEQERASARSLQSEVDELRIRSRSQGDDLPLTDEAKEYRFKLMAAEQQMEGMQVELRELRIILNEEKRKTRSNDSDAVTKDRMDTELRNLKQELGKQRYMVEELQSKDNTLSKQVAEWHKKYLSLKDAYKSDTDAWQKELTDFEQELNREKAQHVVKENVSKELEKEAISYRTKLATLEDENRTLTEALQKKDKDYKDKLGRLESDFARESKELQELRSKYDQQDQVLAQEDTKIRQDKSKLENKISALTRELEEKTETYQKEVGQWKKELNELSKIKQDMERTIQEMKLKAELEKNDGALATFTTRGSSVTERARAADQIKEEVEKLHKQQFELQKQLMDARRVGDDAKEQMSRNERRWTTEKDELNRKLRQDEKIHKAELSAVSMRFENRQKLLEDETKTLSSTVKQLKIERDALQERFDGVWREVTKLRTEHADCATKLEITTSQFNLYKTSREALDKQVEDMQAKTSRLEQEKNDAKAKGAKEKSTYELRIAELQNKLSQYEGQHAYALSAYSLKARQMTSPVPGRSRMTFNGDTEDRDLKDIRERLDGAEKALKKSEKDISDSKSQVASLKLDKERESDLLRAKIRELQARQRPLTDAHDTLKLAYDSVRTEYEVVRTERDDLAERLAENESSQIKERGKIDQILVEIQRLKEVAPLFTSEEDLQLKRPSRVKERSTLLEEKSSTLNVTDPRKYKGKKSTDLQKAIENIEKVSEDIKAERKIRRSIKPHKRSHSASIAEAGTPSGPSRIRRYPSVDADDADSETSVVTLPAPTPLQSIAKVHFPIRNPRFPSLPPSFILTPPSAIRDNRRSRSYENQHHGASAITEECFSNPGGSWDSIDSDFSFDNYSFIHPRPLPRSDTSSFTSLPNLPDKVDSATSTDDRPKKSLRKQIMDRMRPHSLHSSVESIQEKVEKTDSLKLSHNAMATQTSRSPSPMSLSETVSKTSDKPGNVSPHEKLRSLSLASKNETGLKKTGGFIKAIPEPRLEAKDVLKNAVRSLSPVGKNSATRNTGTDASTSSRGNAEKETKTDDKSKEAKKPVITSWRKPISDLAKKFESKGK